MTRRPPVLPVCRLIALVASLTLASAMPQGVVAAMEPVDDLPPGPRCRIESRMARPVPPMGAPIDAGYFAVRIDTAVSRADSTYMVDLLRQVLPSMVRVLGLPPAELDTLTLSIGGCGGMSSYYVYDRLIEMRRRSKSEGTDEDGDGRVDEDLYDGRDNDGDGAVDEDLASSPDWDNTFIHELTHAFQTDLLSDRGHCPSWLTEGTAEAVAWCVPEAALTSVEGRSFRARWHDRNLASFDLVDQGAAQLLGGRDRLVDRFDSGVTYRAAEATLMIPVLAELDAGRVDPHPLARLFSALREEATRERPSAWKAIDRAWSTPVDGVHPPGRWIRSRAITNYHVRDGVFLGLFPAYPRTALNPPFLRAIGFRREGWTSEVLHTRNPLVFTDSRGRRFEQPDSFHPIIPLDPGAYRVDIEDEFDGTPVRAHNWILVTPSGRTIWDSREGIGLIFVGRDGNPIEVPDLEINGRIVEEVPGGVVVAPRSSLYPDDVLTVSGLGRPLGTVTIPGTLSRVVPLFVDDPAAPGVLSWQPYEPAPGDTLTVWLRRSESELDPDSSEASTVLWDEDGTRQVTAPLVGTGVPDLYLARIPVPGESRPGFLGCESGSSRHGGVCRGSRTTCYSVEISSPARPRLTRVEQTTRELVLTFDRPAGPVGLALQYSSLPAGPWRAADVEPRPDAGDARIVRLAIESVAGTTAWYRILAGAGGDEQVLFTGRIGSPLAVPGFTASLPFPNPTPDGVRWTVSIDTTATLDFEVFDVNGRLVYGPSPQRMTPGSHEIRWNGLGVTGPMPAGCYFLRLSGPGGSQSRRAVLLRGRTR